MTCKEFRSITIVLMFSLLTFVASTAAASVEPAGTVVAVRGKVEATGADGAQRLLKMKSDIFEGDTIQTTKTGRIQLMFKDNTIISLGPKSEMKVAEYLWDERKKDGKMKTRVEEGTFRVLGGLITKSSPKNFTTETPAATIGIRGSMYAGRVSGGHLDVVFLGGTGIYVINEHGRVDIVAPGEGSSADRGTPPQEPFTMPPKDVSELLEGLNGPATGSGDDAADYNRLQGFEADSDDEPLVPPMIVATVEQVVEETTSTNTQEAASGTIQGEGLVATAQALLTGRSLRIWTPELIPGPNWGYRYVVADSQGGNIYLEIYDEVPTGQAPIMTSDDGNLVTPFTITNYNPDGTFSGIDQNIEVLTITTTYGTFPKTRKIDFDDEFFVVTGDYELHNAGGLDHMFGTQYFAGVPTLAAELPTTGIDSYLLQVFTGYYDGTTLDVENAQATMYVNWENHKVIGGIDTPGTFFYGDVDGSGAIIVNFVGSGWNTMSPPYDIAAIDGNSSFGQIYGSAYQGIGITADGFDYATFDQTSSKGDWFGNIAGFRDPDYLTKTSPTGSLVLEGNAVAIMEDMSNPINRVHLGQTLASNLTLTIDQDSGQITGTLQGMRDILNPPMELYRLGDLEIGGAYGSAYIDRDHFIAEIGCSTGGCLWDYTPTTPALSSSFPQHGNYIITAPEGEQIFGDYLTWGYWEAVFTDDVAIGGMTQLHAHVPASIWIAGETTPDAVIDNLISSSSFVGNYQGPAMGHYTLTGDTNFYPLTNGVTNLSIDFPTQSVSGSINFSEVNLAVTTTWQVQNFGFNANLGGDVIWGSIDGDFYGPNVNAIGGSFDAYDSINTRYTGIFGGDLTNGPAP